MFRKILVFTFLSLSLLAFSPALATDIWRPAADGIDFAVFELPGPNVVYVTRMDRTNPNVVLDTMIGQGSFTGGKETVSDMANRYDGSVSLFNLKKPHTQRVVAAINGSFYDVPTGIPQGGMIQSGWYIKRYTDQGGGTGFAWRYNGSAFIGECLDNVDDRQTVKLIRDGRTQSIRGINEPRRATGLYLYTPQYGPNTEAADNGLEAVVEMLNPLSITEGNRMSFGVVKAVRKQEVAAHIPFDHVVLSTGPNSSSRLLEHLQVGDVIGFTLEVKHTDSKCKSINAESWTGVYSSMDGSFDFLRAGEIFEHSDNLGAVTAHPRTAICFDEQYLHFVVVDGRADGYSRGMSMGELGKFCRDTLGSDYGINQDGGGSTTMWLNGQVVNRPSDGSERLVSNGYMMVALEPAARSTRFLAGDPVLTRWDTDLHLGPGPQYGIVGSVAKSQAGVIQFHRLGMNGIYAKGNTWWLVNFNGQSGWLQEDALVNSDQQSIPLPQPHEGDLDRTENLQPLFEARSWLSIWP